MTTSEILELISVLLVLLATIPYVWAIVRMGTRPPRSTWIVWTVLSVLIIAAGDWSWQMLSILLVDVAILGFAFWYGEGAVWTKTDIASLVLAGFSISLWQSFLMKS
mgnify:FL=1